MSEMRRMRRCGLALVAAAGTALCGAPALAQSLLQQHAQPESPAQAPGQAPGQPPPQTPVQVVPGQGPIPVPVVGAPQDPASALRQYSLFAVVPPPPRQFQKQDIVQIIINETSIQKFEQRLDRKKDYELNAVIEQLPDFEALLGLRLEPGERSPLAAAGASATNEFKGDGKVERKDQLTTRVSARVIEVKPNGLLLLEARKTVQSDKEVSTVVVSGLCRPEDVTKSNTVQSTQLADLVIRVENEGEARDAAKRGIITQVLDTVFNF